MSSRQPRYSISPNSFDRDLASNRNEPVDRVNKLSELTMSSYLTCHSKIKKRFEIKGQLTSANQLAFIPGDGPSRMMVSDHSSGRVVVFMNQKTPAQDLITNIRPHGVAALDRQTVIVVDDNELGLSGSVKVVRTAEDGTISMVDEWAKDLERWQPRAVTVNKNGQVIVTNVHPEAIERFRLFTAEGREVMSFGRADGPGDLVFQTPDYVTVDDLGRILSTDRTGNCVKVYDARGRYVREFGNVAKETDKDSKLSVPMGLACDNRGNTVVCDMGNRRLAMFSHDGRFIQNLHQPKNKRSPISVAFNGSADQLALTVHDRVGCFRKIVLYNYVCT